MNTIRIYVDEKLDGKNMTEFLMAISHVVDVEAGKDDEHELVIDYEESDDMPIKIIETLRDKGFHPDVLSA